LPPPDAQPSSSFDEAWQRFQALDSLAIAGDTSEWGWSRGRAQYLTFLVRVEDTAALDHLSRVAERLAAIPGVEPFPEAYWHVTVKGAGFQVIKRSLDDDILRQDVPRIAGKARALFASEEAFDAQLGLANAFAGVVFVEVLDGGRLRSLNDAACAGLPDVPAYPFDGAAFLPHVSVARFTSDEGLAQLWETLASLRGEGPGPPLPVRRVEFVKAWLSEDAPELETLASYALRSPR